MKKALTLFLTVAIMVSMIGCSTNGTPKTESSSTVDLSASNNTQPNIENSEGISTTPEGKPIVKRTYGKVTSIVGNEIDVLMGTPERDIIEEMNKSLNDQFIPEEKEVDKGENMAAIMITPATPAGEIGGAIAGGSVEKNESIVPIVYTEETVSYIVPTGIPYIDMAMGAKTGLESIKEGMIICVETLEDGTATVMYFLS